MSKDCASTVGWEKVKIFVDVVEGGVIIRVSIDWFRAPYFGGTSIRRDCGCVAECGPVEGVGMSTGLVKNPACMAKIGSGRS